MLSAADDELAVTCLSDGDGCAFVTAFVAAVNCYKVVAAAAADAYFNASGVVNNQWAGAEAMGRNWGQCQYAGLGSYNGASHAE